MNKLKDFFSSSIGGDVTSYACGAETVKNPRIKCAYKALQKYAKESKANVVFAGAGLYAVGEIVEQMSYEMGGMESAATVFNVTAIGLKAMGGVLGAGAAGQEARYMINNKQKIKNVAKAIFVKKHSR